MSHNFKRSCSLSLSGGSSERIIVGGGPTDLRIQFEIEQWSLQSPNTMWLRVTNPSKGTVAKFKQKEFTKVSFSAGYEDNVGVIYEGDIKQTIDGHISTIDSFVEIYCGDGQFAYQAARVSTTLAKGYTPKDKFDVAMKAMAPYGITPGLINVDLSQPRYPRGLPLAGMAHQVLREIALSARATWSIQTGKLCMVDQKQPISGNTITLSPTTGLIGWPRQTADGVETVSLINPALQVHVNVKLDPSTIQAAQQNINPVDTSAAATNNALDQQDAFGGIYNIYKINRRGDTRSTEWYDTAFMLGTHSGIVPNVAQQGYFIGNS